MGYMKMKGFGQALRVLKAGSRVARAGWNGKGMFLFLVPGSTFKVNRPPLLGIYPEGAEINYLPHIDMRTATGEIVPWLASQSDMLAEDWYVVDPAGTAQPEPGEPLEIINADIDRDGPPKFLD